jgi:hypothetical protein
MNGSARRTERLFAMGENVGCAPEGATNTARDDLQLRLTREGAPFPMMVPPEDAVHAPCRVRHAEDADTIRRLRTALERALAQRDEYMTRASHFFVNDGQGYCLACATVAKNIRHADRAA